MAQDILIVGATGQQGRAVIKALSVSALITRDNPNPPFRILALTRSASSPKSVELLATYPHIVAVEGDMSNAKALFAAQQDIVAAFFVTVPPNDEDQALPFIGAAVASPKMKHIVFSSVDRGGDLASWQESTVVPHFAAKHRIELQLRDMCDKTGTQWTILRPTGFMDTYNPGFFGKLMTSLWAAGMPSAQRIQMISTHDIGVFAAKALQNPDRWAGRALALAGDDLSFLEFREVFRRVVRREPPQTLGVLARPVLWWVEDAKRSFEWFRTVGYGANIEVLRLEEPTLQTFEQWLRADSQWSCGAA